MTIRTTSIVVLQDYLRSGGTEKHSLFLARRFGDFGIDAYLLTFRPGGALAREAIGVQRRSLQHFDWHVDWFAPGLIRTLARAAPRVILCMGFNANLYGAWLQRRFPDTAVVGTVRTGLPLPALYRYSLGRVRSIQVNTQWWREQLVGSGLDAGKITVVHNPLLLHPDAIDDHLRRRDALRRELGLAPGVCVFVCVQDFHRGKNHAELIRAFSRVPADIDWRLLLAGDGVQRGQCQSLAAELDLTPRVRFVGFANEPLRYYAAADVAVSASTRDALPNFLIEAQAAGLPVIAMDAMGIGEALDPNRTGLLLPPGDADALVEAVVRFSRDEGLRRELGGNAIDFARHAFSPDRQVARTLDALGTYLS